MLKPHLSSVYSTLLTFFLVMAVKEGQSGYIGPCMSECIKFIIYFRSYYYQFERKVVMIFLYVHWSTSDKTLDYRLVFRLASDLLTVSWLSVLAIAWLAGLIYLSDCK